MDRDGFISNGELYLVLKQMVGNNLKVGCLGLSGSCHADTALGPATTTDRRQDNHGGGQGWVSRSSFKICVLTRRRDGKLSFEEFTNMVASTDIVK